MSGKSKLIVAGIFLSLLVASCGEAEAPSWQVIDEMHLGEFSPIGIAAQDSILWISDGDGNQVGAWTTTGQQVDLYQDFSRPMHLDFDNGQVIVPEYGTDTIRTIDSGGSIGHIELGDSLDAPAGIDADRGRLVIADFYNHRVVVQLDGTWRSYGEEGSAPGEFNYPTDVQLVGDLIYVADAYNNRVQVLSAGGDVISVFGREHGMNAATGLFVEGEEIFVTDFENSRLLVFDTDGVLQQIIENVEKPTDAVTIAGRLYVTSYTGNKVYVLERS